MTDAVIEVDCVGDDFSPLKDHARQMERQMNEAHERAERAERRFQWLLDNPGMTHAVRDLAARLASDAWHKAYPNGGPGYGGDYVSAFVGEAIDRVA